MRSNIKSNSYVSALFITDRSEDFGIMDKMRDHHIERKTRKASEEIFHKSGKRYGTHKEYARATRADRLVNERSKRI